MSALGQKQTCALQNGMSALPPKATLIASACEPLKVAVHYPEPGGLALVTACARHNEPPEITQSPGAYSVPS